jgi:hypothetical protein
MLLVILGCSIVFFASNMLIKPASAVLSSSTGNIDPHGHWYEYAEYIETPADAAKPREFYFHSNATVDLFLLNTSAFGTWLANGTLLAAPAFVATTDAVESWSIDFLNETRGFEIQASAQGNRKVVLFVLAVNSANVTVKFTE